MIMEDSSIVSSSSELTDILLSFCVRLIGFKIKYESNTFLNSHTLLYSLMLRVH
jgi:hypothetical protein